MWYRETLSTYASLKPNVPFRYFLEKDFVLRIKQNKNCLQYTGWNRQWVKDSTQPLVHPLCQIRIIIVPSVICESGDADSSLTLDYPEFCRLMRMERKLFAADAFGKIKSGVLSMDESIQVLKSVNWKYDNISIFPIDLLILFY